MQPDPFAGLLVVVLFLLAGMKMLLGRIGLFRGFFEGFWAAVFSRLIVGGRGPGAGNPFGCTVMAALLFLLLFLIGLIGTICG